MSLGVEHDANMSTEVKNVMKIFDFISCRDR